MGTCSINLSKDFTQHVVNEGYKAIRVDAVWVTLRSSLGFQ
ncbi:hypothetical protein SynA1560_02185 [Synechococcus sp. A15-60]|nr:hypothetical protein SynA1560_02185 [Synechococcus sp. A15-60]